MSNVERISYKSFEKLSKHRSLEGAINAEKEARAEQVSSQKSLVNIDSKEDPKSLERIVPGESSRRSVEKMAFTHASTTAIRKSTTSAIAIKKSTETVPSSDISKKSSDKLTEPSQVEMEVTPSEVEVPQSFATASIIDIPEADLIFLDGLPDVILVETVTTMDDELRRYNLENLVFEHFLEKNDRTALKSMNQVLEQALKMTKDSTSPYERGLSNTSQGQSQSSVVERSSRTSSIKQSIRGSIFTLAQEKGPRINLTQKTDLVLREMEETQNSFQNFVKRSHRLKCNLKAELEEIGIRKSEIKEAREIFEQVVVIEGLDPLTQRIPAEKFIRYMEEWLKSAQAVLEKVRLRVSTYKIQYKKVSVQLLQKQELGETLHAVDFEQLQIENKNFTEKIDQKNAHLLELKKMNGTANLVLSTHKQHLQKQMEDLNTLKAVIQLKGRKVDDLDRDSETAEVELEAAREKFENMKELVTSYKVPDVMEYIKKKAELYELKKNLKVWSRRKHIQDIALKSCLREMKNITGISDPSPSWFKET